MTPSGGLYKDYMREYRGDTRSLDDSSYREGACFEKTPIKQPEEKLNLNCPSDLVQPTAKV